MIERPDDDYPPEAYDDPRLMELLDLVRAMPEKNRERFIRFARRFLAIPLEARSAVTPEMMAYMLKHDVDLPRH